MIVIYNTLQLVLVLMGIPVWLPLAIYSEKRRETLWPRLWPKRSLPPLPAQASPIWVHALSVGEVLSSEPLLRGIRDRFPRRPVFFSASTLTGFRMARRRLAPLCTRIGFFPWDLPLTVKRALDFVHPALLIMVETDVWPNFMYEIQRRKVPALLVNARLSDRSLRGYQLFSFFFRPLFSIFDRICVQSEMDAGRFCVLGLDRGKIHLSGNLKFDQRPADMDASKQDRLRLALGLKSNTPVVVAGSTHEGEERLLLTSMARLKRNWPSLVMILAPRDPKRAEMVLDMAKSAGFGADLFSELNNRQDACSPDVILVDRMGQLRTLYAISAVSFVGGSLVRQGGHNPLEPAALGKPILFGPDMRDFLSISNDLKSAGGAVTVRDMDDFCRMVNYLIENPKAASEMGKRARAVFRSQGGAVERIMAIAADYIAD